uniref:Uncharacterized protein n=1 Tax=Rhodnius prolixus TaxID=13249 RepID=T1IFF3_RHOPR
MSDIIQHLSSAIPLAGDGEKTVTLDTASTAAILKFPNSLNWTLATRLSECFSGVNMDVSGQHSLFRIDIIREATIASKSLPDIPKAFATLLIAMVSQKYLTINDLESHALALLHFEWAKELTAAFTTSSEE